MADAAGVDTKISSPARRDPQEWTTRRCSTGSAPLHDGRPGRRLTLEIRPDRTPAQQEHLTRVLAHSMPAACRRPRCARPSSQPPASQPPSLQASLSFTIIAFIGQARREAGPARLAHLELVERLHEILDQGVEVSGRDAHASCAVFCPCRCTCTVRPPLRRSDRPVA